MEAPTRKGRIRTKNAEVPAAPAANKKGKSGKQQLDAKIALPRAARLANAVLVERLRLSLGSLVPASILLALLCGRDCPLQHFFRRQPVASRVQTARESERLLLSWFRVQAVDPDGRRTRESKRARGHVVRDRNLA